MDATRAIQAAVVRTDLLICNIRASPKLWMIVLLGAGLLACALFHTIDRRQR